MQHLVLVACFPEEIPLPILHLNVFPLGLYHALTTCTLDLDSVYRPMPAGNAPGSSAKSSAPSTCPARTSSARKARAGPSHRRATITNTALIDEARVITAQSSCTGVPPGLRLQRETRPRPQFVSIQDPSSQRLTLQRFERRACGQLSTTVTRRSRR